VVINMDRWLSPLLSELGYPQLQRWNASAQGRPDEALALLRNSINSSFAIFCLPAQFLEISTFATKIHHWMTEKPDDYNFLTHSLSLDEQGLRRLFTGIELLVYKLNVLTGTTPRERRERFEGGKTKIRFKRLVERKVLPGEVKELFDEVMFTRNAYAHSFLDVREITYYEVPLASCFGTGWLAEHIDENRFPSPDAPRVFTHDVRQLTDQLIGKFRPIQFQQLDKEKLFDLCDRKIQRRKMIP
jgi:hypothetical protein